MTDKRSIRCLFGLHDWRPVGMVPLPGLSAAHRVTIQCRRCGAARVVVEQ